MLKKDIVVLSRYRVDNPNSCLYQRLVPEDIGKIKTGVKNFQENKDIRFYTIQSFKGLESKVVLLIDVDDFSDKDSVNHGELGAKILFEDGEIRRFIEDDKYDNIIKTAILNHNRNRETMQWSNEKEELHSKIIRDADKIDILYILTFEEKEVAWGKTDMSDEKITDEIYREFMNKESIDYKKCETTADKLVSNFAYLYDLNYKYSLQIIKEKGYIDKIYERFKFNDNETKIKYNNIYKKVNEYLEIG